MSTILLLLRTVHENVHDFTMKLNFSEPKIFTGGVFISDWTKLSKLEQKAALEKDWYIYYSFRNPQTGTVEIKPNIKVGANEFKSKIECLLILKKLYRNLIKLSANVLSG